MEDSIRKKTGQVGRGFLMLFGILRTLLGGKRSPTVKNDRTGVHSSPPSEDQEKEFRRYDIGDLMLP